MNTLGEILKKLRNEKEGKLTQKDVALSIGYTRDTYANWEINRGQPDNNALRALARYFSCSTDYLLGLSDQKIPLPNILAASQIGGETEKHKLILEKALKYAWEKVAKEDDSR